MINQTKNFFFFCNFGFSIFIIINYDDKWTPTGFNTIHPNNNMNSIVTAANGKQIKTVL